MHVAVAGWLAPLGPSGARRRGVELLRAAALRLHEGETITWLGAPPPEDLPGVAVRPVAIAPQPTWRRARHEQRVLPRLLAELAADVLDLATLPVPRRLPCPVCLTIHDLRDLTAYRRRPRALARAALRRGLARAAQVVVPSRFTESELRRCAGAALPPVAVVPNGVGEAFFAPPCEAPPPFRYFLHVGHLERRKNVPLLLRAYARLGSDAPRLLLAGADAGGARAVRRAIAALGLASRVHVLGVVGETRLRALYAGATAVVVPSRYEGFGLPLLEACAAGAPVIASDAAALPEIAGGCAELLPPADVEAWARALRRHAAAGAAAEQAAARRAHARAFGWDGAAAAMLAVWRAAAATR